MTRAVRSDHQLYAGDLLEFAGTVDSGLVGARLSAAVKRYRGQSDADAYARVSADTSDITIESATAYSVRFDATLTRSWPVGDLWYDVQAEVSGEVLTIAEGRITVRRRITRAHLEPGARPPLIAGTGALVLTGADVTMLARHTLTAETGTLVLTGADATLTASLIASLGSRLHFWYEVGFGETLVGSVYSQLNDRGPYGRNVAQATSGRRPTKATGGPNGSAWISFDAVDKRLSNTALGITSGRALTFFAIARVPAPVNPSVAVTVRTGAAELSTNDVAFSVAQLPSEPGPSLTCSAHLAGIEETRNVLTPAYADAWRSHVQRYATGTSPTLEVNDVVATLTAPALGTGVCPALATVVLGHVSQAGGGVTHVACVEDCTAIDKARMRAYQQLMWAV